MLSDAISLIVAYKEHYVQMIDSNFLTSFDIGYGCLWEYWAWLVKLNRIIVLVLPLYVHCMFT